MKLDLDLDICVHWHKVKQKYEIQKKKFDKEYEIIFESAIWLKHSAS